jgi:signal transduction histidine kinase
MGLAMVKRMVESRGGRITIGSNEPRGAVFRIVWPLRGTAS